MKKQRINVKNLKDIVQNEITLGNEIEKYGYSSQYGTYLKNGIWKTGSLYFDTLINFSWVNGCISPFLYFFAKKKHTFLNCTFQNTTLTFERASEIRKCFINNFTVVNNVTNSYKGLSLFFYECEIVNSRIEDKNKGSHKMQHPRIHVSKLDNSTIKSDLYIELSELSRCKVYDGIGINYVHARNCELANNPYIANSELIESNIKDNEIKISTIYRSNIENAKILNSTCINSTATNCSIDGVIWESGVIKDSLWISGTWKSGTWINGTVEVFFVIYDEFRRERLLYRSDNIRTRFDPHTIMKLLSEKKMSGVAHNRIGHKYVSHGSIEEDGSIVIVILATRSDFETVQTIYKYTKSKIEKMLSSKQSIK